MTARAQLATELSAAAPLTAEEIRIVRARAKATNDYRTLYLCDRALLEMLGTGDSMTNDQKIAAEREGFAVWASNAQVPADFTRRVRENPQIAIDLLRALLTAQRMLKDWAPAVQVSPAGDLKLRQIEDALAAATGPDLTRTHAHYAAEMALDAAARTGEEPLPEHRQPPYMRDMDEDVQSLMDRDMG